MAEQNKYFIPEHVDEQIEQITRLSRMYDVDVPPEERLIHDLHIEYEINADADAGSLSRAWTRLAATRQQESITRPGETVELIATQQSVHQQNTPSRKRIWSQRMNILVAAALITFLLGSSIFIFAHASLNHNTLTASRGNRSLAPVLQPTMPPTPTSTQTEATVLTFNPTSTPTATPTPYIAPTPTYCEMIYPSAVTITVVKGTTYAPVTINTTSCGAGAVTVTSSPGIIVLPSTLTYSTPGASAPAKILVTPNITSGTYSATFSSVNGGSPTTITITVKVLIPTPTPSVVVTPSVPVSPTVSVTPVVTAVATPTPTPTPCARIINGKCG